MEKLGKQDQGAPEQKTVQKYQKNCTLRNIKTRYTLDTSTKQWSGQDLIIRAQSTAIFLCIQPFSAW